MADAGRWFKSTFWASEFRHMLMFSVCRTTLASFCKLFINNCTFCTWMHFLLDGIVSCELVLLLLLEIPPSFYLAWNWLGLHLMYFDKQVHFWLLSVRYFYHLLICSFADDPLQRWKSSFFGISLYFVWLHIYILHVLYAYINTGACIIIILNDLFM